nr:unnamed protein product [Spirometra erinaceieuropaei]
MELKEEQGGPAAACCCGKFQSYSSLPGILGQRGRMEINRNSCVYTPQYCEENVYKLLENIQLTSESDFYAVFISNPKKQVPLFFQKKGDANEDNLVVWDYHVIAIEQLPASSIVYDLDTTLDFPISFKDYWSKAVRPNHCFREPFFRFFRVVATCSSTETQRVGLLLHPRTSPSMV